jgi:hypothetical protein
VGEVKEREELSRCGKIFRKQDFIKILRRQAASIPLKFYRIKNTHFTHGTVA